MVRAETQEPRDRLGADEGRRLHPGPRERAANLEGGGLEADELHQLCVELAQRDRKLGIGNVGASPDTASRSPARSACVSGSSGRKASTLGAINPWATTCSICSCASSRAAQRRSCGRRRDGNQRERDEDERQPAHQPLYLSGEAPVTFGNV